VQAYLAAAVMNLKCLVAHGGGRPAVAQAAQLLQRAATAVYSAIKTVFWLPARVTAVLAA
jgi:hypothetical protein